MMATGILVALTLNRGTALAPMANGKRNDTVVFWGCFLARTFLGFIGFAGQYVYKQYAFTLSFDIQLNDDDRAIRTEEQIDIALSYTY